MRGDIVIKAFCTDILPPDERAQYWTDAVHRSLTRLEVRPHDGAAVRGSLRRISIGDIHVAHVEASPQRMARTRGIIANDPSGLLIVSLQETGSSVVVQDGRETPLVAGELVLLDSRRPYVQDFPGDVRQDVAAVPRGLLDVSDACLLLATGRACSTGSYIGGILAAYMSRLAAAAEVGVCPPGPKRYLERGMADVLNALVVHQVRRGSGATPTAEEALLRQIRVYVRAHLDRTELSPATIAAAHHISVRYLHLLFRGEDMTVGRWVQHLRLEACRDDLSRPELAGATVAAIAQRRGFASPAHFSRIFRAAYGMTPGEWRCRAGHSRLPG
ncbi:helix-turn-helix domain-containing protein [Streptomyces sp. NPDC088354]|uniref:helix-turn-helix domain-containing protein n=1 Tax=Streptomyces sp. NPDC088354 TaxID=3365856 RepID=UPI0038091D3D